MSNGEVLRRTTQDDAAEEQSAPCVEKSWCAGCVNEDGCGWCEGTQASRGSCQPQEDACSQPLVTDNSQCPNVGADVVLRNVSGLLGAMLAVAVLLNILNRCQNKRRKQNLKRSIFTLPVYVYPSREKLLQARREARARLEAPSDATQEVEDGQSEASDDASSVVTCTICLAAYENDELIKVLPCGHDFHSGCLDSWLELKAMCPLCKKHAFSKWRDGHWNGHRNGHHGQSQVHALSPPAGLVTNPPRGRSWLGSPVAPTARPSASDVEGAGQEGTGIAVDGRGATWPRGSLELAANGPCLATESADIAQTEAGITVGARARGDAIEKGAIASVDISAAGTRDAAAAAAAAATGVAAAEVDGCAARGEPHEEPTPCWRSPRWKIWLRRGREASLGELEVGRAGSVAVPGYDSEGGVANDGSARVERSESEAEAATGGAEMSAPTSARMVALVT